MAKIVNIQEPAARSFRVVGYPIVSGSETRTVMGIVPDVPVRDTLVREIVQGWMEGIPFFADKALTDIRKDYGGYDYAALISPDVIVGIKTERLHTPYE